MIVTKDSIEGQLENVVWETVIPHIAHLRAEWEVLIVDWNSVKQATKI